MKREQLVMQLDKEFTAGTGGEDLVQWAVTQQNLRLILPDFLEHRTGLMVAGADTISAVRTAVFVTDRIVERLRTDPPSLLFTHHNFDYYEDKRGLQPIRPAQMEDLLSHGHSIYVAHARLDTHSQYGTSLALAATIGVQAKEHFYDYFGEPVALICDAGDCNFQNFAAHVRKQLQRPAVDLKMYSPCVRRVAVAAGGGDLPDLLQEAHDRGCDTMVTGTLIHRWAIPAVQEGHERFLKLNEKLRLNVIGGSHYGTERPAMIHLIEFFTGLGISCEYCEDEDLLNAL